MVSKVDFYPKSLQRKYNVELYIESAFKLAEIWFLAVAKILGTFSFPD